MFFSKCIKLGLLSSFMFFAMSNAAFASSWTQDANGAWRYILNNGSYATDMWVTSGNEKYYLDSNGFLTTNSLIEGGNIYYVKEHGEMAKNEWVAFLDEENPNETNWYYFGEDGKAFQGREDKLNPKTINGKNYAFDTDGHMICGFVTKNGEKIEETSNSLEFVDAMYFFGNDGAMYQNQWLKYEDIGKTGTYSELAQRNYNEFDELWLYFGQNGKKLAAPNYHKAKLGEIKGKTYAFDENGIMIPGLFLSEWTASSSNATMSNATIRYGSEDESGENVGDYWTFTVPNEAMSEEDYRTQEYSWFRTKKNGTIIRDRIAKVNERKYAFDEIGRMQTGFVVMLEDGSFGVQFDVDEWSREHFLEEITNTKIPTIDRGDLYLFGTDELNDGSMIVGETTVVLNDGAAVFGFQNNGKAIGNQGKLTKHRGKYYYNGLRIDADMDVKYGILQDSRYGQSDYVVVDTVGKVITGNKIVRDGDGYWIIIKNSKFVARISDYDKPKMKNGKFYRYDSTAKYGERLLEEITFETHGYLHLDSQFVRYE